MRRKKSKKAKVKNVLVVVKRNASTFRQLSKRRNDSLSRFRKCENRITFEENPWLFLFVEEKYEEAESVDGC
jgi:hypothetical protein